MACTVVLPVLDIHQQIPGSCRCCFRLMSRHMSSSVPSELLALLMRWSLAWSCGTKLGMSCTDSYVQSTSMRLLSSASLCLG